MKLRTALRTTTATLALFAPLGPRALGGTFPPAHLASLPLPFSAAAIPGVDSTSVDPYFRNLEAGMHGAGYGKWRGPDGSVGRVRATLSLAGAKQSFALDAWLAQIVPMGP